MSDLAGNLESAAENADSVDTAPTGESGSGENPAWAELRESLDPISYSKVVPHLQKFDSDAKTRIEAQNKEFGWAKELTKQGITPDYIAQALAATSALQNRPEEVYASLQTFLAENGRLPDKQELADQVEEDKDENQAPADPRLDQIAQQQQQLADAFQQQQQAQAQAVMLQQAEAELTQETTALKQAHPEFAEADVKEVLRRAASTAALTGNVPTLESEAQGWLAEINRIRSTPRPGDSAPRLLPTNGGVPSTSGVTQKALGQMKNQDIQSMIADSLKAANGS